LTASRVTLVPNRWRRAARQRFGARVDRHAGDDAHAHAGGHVRLDHVRVDRLEHDRRLDAGGGEGRVDATAPEKCTS